MSFPFALIMALSLYLPPPMAAAGGRGQEGASGSRTDNRSDAGRDKDNTGVNKRDRSEQQTADKQKNAKSDVTITAEIRRAITKDKSMSMNARNVKIITKDGKVVLKGPVVSAEEKKAIEDKAEQIVGAGVVTSEIEVKHE